MKGVNHIKLNEATVITAIQEYFDKRSAALVAPFDVSGVSAEGGPSDKWFVVRVVGNEDGK